MSDIPNPSSFRHAVLAVAVAFASDHRGLPGIVRTSGRAIGLRVMRYLDERRARLDSAVWR
jgi:hypothetical protein